MAFTGARTVIADAIAHHAFPGASVEIGTAGEVRWREAFGHVAYDRDAAETTLNTVFDLASLTKVIATTTAAMHLVAAHRLQLTDPVARWLPEWRGEDRSAVTVEDLLLHAAGLPAWLPLFREHQGRQAFTAAIARVPLEYAPRTASVYSDLGFILLGIILENAAQQPLDQQFVALRSQLGLGDLTFRPPEAWKPRTAPTEFDPWRGRLLRGEVHDENAAALGGVAGHAGLFGVVSAVGTFAQWVLRARAGDRDACERLAAQETMRRFTTRGAVPGSSRALGWDTMLATSSCGTRLSSSAFGHTGFTGTSLWIDPVRDLYVVLLTNRVHPSRDNELITQVRPAFHDAAVEGIDARA
jgi:CubicO group peptidase (beta-lactamase class C family)